MKLISIVKQMLEWCIQPSQICQQQWQIDLQSMSQRQLADLIIPSEEPEPKACSVLLSSLKR